MQKHRRALAALLALASAGCGDSAGRALTSPEGVGPRLSQATYVGVCCPMTVYQGAQYQVHADVRDGNNNPISNPAVNWTTSGNGVAAIYPNGSTAVVQAVGVGQTTIHAQVNGVQGQTTLTVLAAPVVTTVQILNAPLGVQMGQPRSVSARALDQYGNPVNGASFTYSIQNTSVATVSSTGVITPVSTGTTTVTVTSNGTSATAQVNVVPQINVSFYGPNTIWSEGSYGWDVSASGGTGSFTYQWYVDYAYGSYTEDAGTGTSAGLYVSGGTGPFAIRVIVTSGGASTEAGTFVCNFIEGANC
ncbi:MAG TPA: Ig-like domain-containing protein [Longimicrobium sp.]|nr:Ig-like domain-containing protein [Longimicrobium sp.]